MLLYTVIILCGVLLLCLWHGLKRPIYFLSYGYALSMLCQSACLLWLYKGCVSHVLVLLHAMLFIGYGLRLLFYLIVHSFNTVYNTMGAAQAHCTLSIPRSVLLMCACSFLFFCMVSPLLSVLLSIHCGHPIHKATQCIGVLSMLLGISLESVADYQKSHYGRPHPELYCARGLFYYVRMPNYLGEILFWVGNCVVSASTSTCAFLLLCNTIGSLFSITIMLFSAFDLDAKQLRYSQKDPEYIAYRNRTHVLYPLPSF